MIVVEVIELRNGHNAIYLTCQIHMTNVNTIIILSTVYPAVSTLFYIVKNHCEQNRHVCAILNHIRHAYAQADPHSSKIYLALYASLMT